MKLDNKAKKFIIIGIGAIFFIYIVLKLIATGSISAVVSGLYGMTKLFIFVGIAGALIYFLFLYQKKINVLVETRKKMIEACRLNSMFGMGDLITEGDDKHSAKQYGKIIGYCQVPTSKESGGKYEFAHTFLVRIYGRSFVDKVKSFLSKGELFIIPNKMVDELTGDVYVKCNSFIKYAHNWYPNNCYMDYNLLDKTVYNEADRFAKTEYMAHIVTQINKASGIDRSDEEKVEGKSGYKMYKEFRGTKPENKQGGNEE